MFTPKDCFSEGHELESRLYRNSPSEDRQTTSRSSAENTAHHGWGDVTSPPPHKQRGGQTPSLVAAVLRWLLALPDRSGVPPQTGRPGSGLIR